MTPEAAATLPATTRLVLAAGMPRSGSTAVFNLARLLLEGQRRPLTSGWIEDVTEPVQAALLLKVHEWHPELAQRADLVLTSHRDLRAVARSLAALDWLWPGDGAFDHLAHLVQAHDRWSAVAALDLRYESMVQDWQAATRKVARALGVDPPRTEMEAIAQQVAQMKTAVPAGRDYDPVTLMHRGHRHEDRGATAPLTIEDEIHRRFSSWQKRHRYT